MIYLRLFALRVATDLFGCFGLLDARPYRSEGGATGRFYIAARVDRRK